MEFLEENFLYVSSLKFIPGGIHVGLNIGFGLIGSILAGIFFVLWIRSLLKSKRARQ